MPKPKIVMFPHVSDRDIDKPSPSKGCIRGLETAGAEVVLADYHTGEKGVLELMAAADALLLQGGDDVDPARYGEEKHEKTSPDAPERDLLETRAVMAAMERDLPLMAICRGVQMLNVALGGTLYQDVPSMLGVEHHQGKDDDFWHDVCLCEGSLVRRIAGCDVLRTNSYHHQSLKKLGEGLVVSAMTGDVIEAVERPASRFLLGLQWHPEVTLDCDEVSQKFFDAFVHACMQ